MGQLSITAACRALIVAALCIAMTMHSLVQPINQDEEQYVAAAYLAQHMRLYADFLYLQPPIYPLILSELMTLFSGTSPFLIARLLSAALAVASILVFFRIAERLSGSRALAALLSALFASAPLMLLAYGWTRNDIMPIFFGLCATWLLVRAIDLHDRSRFAFSGTAGFLMALAVGSKVTAAFIPLAAIAYLCLRARKLLLPLIVGGMIGAIPLAYYAASYPDKFLYSIVLFHLTETIQYYIDIGQADRLTWPAHLASFLTMWAHEPLLLLAVLFLAFAGGIIWFKRSYFDADHHLLLIVLLALAAIPFVALPNPVVLPYLQPAVPYVLLTCAALYPRALKLVDRKQLMCFGILLLVVAALQLGRFSIRTVERIRPSSWTTNEVHDLSALITRYAQGGRIATAYPLLAFDAGGQIYPQFSAGIYFFRSADHLPPQRVMDLNGVSPSTLGTLSPAPTAVFVGGTSVDASLLQWALSHCYTEINLKSWHRGPYHDAIWNPRMFVAPRKSAAATASCATK